MANLNKVMLMGNLTRDPEYKQLPSGQAICRLAMATNRQFKNRQTGVATQEVCYVDVDVWGAQAESCRQYLQKGRSVLVEGRLKLSSWEEPNGQKRSKLFVVAENVVFVGAGAGSVDVEAALDVQEPQTALEKDLLNQIDQIKGRVARSADETKRVKPAASEQQRSTQHATTEQENFGGEMNFKDEPPFEDDLPF